MARKNTLTDQVERAELRARLERHKLAQALAKQARKSVGPRAYFDSYDSATRNRTRVGFRGRQGSHDQHLDPVSHDFLRRDSRQLDRNNPLARALVRRHCDAVVGKGFTLRCESGDPEWNKKAEKFWRNWYETSIDVRGLAMGPQFDRVIHDSAAVDGDILVLKLDNGQCQLIESDLIRQPSQPANGNRCVSGVEIDPAGRIVAFHVSDTAGASSFTYGYTSTRRIPAEFCEFMPSPQHQRVNQTRGEPVLAATIPLLEQLDDLVDSSVLAARLAAYVALVIKAKDPGGLQDSLINASAANTPDINTSVPSGATKSSEWKPGGVLYLEPGEDITPVAPEHPGQQFEAQVRQIIRLIGADFGLPLELSMLDSSQTNYHGFKAAIGNAYRGFARWQEWHARLLTRLFRWRIGKAILDEQIPFIDGWENVRFLAPPPPIIDPKAELEAAAFGINQRIRTRKDTVATLDGTDLDDLYDQFDAEITRENADGIGPVTMPGQVTPAAAGQPSAEPTPASAST